MILLANGFLNSFTMHGLKIICRGFRYYGPPFRWDEEYRFLIRCEDIYDQMKKAMDNGKPCQTLLDLLPGSPAG